MALFNNANNELVAFAVTLMEEDEAEEEEAVLMAARLVVAEIIELEEGPGLGGLLGDAWVFITVNINEYHQMGDPCFQLHFRMSRGVFEALTETVRNHLIEKGRLKRERTPFGDVMLMVVWLLATPDTFRSVALRFGVRPGTLYYFYTYVIEALRELAPVFIMWPDEEERNNIKTIFHRATGFPGVVGCIDCTHIYITAPLQDAAQYVNRHHTYSLNVQAVTDNNLLVRQLHVGEVGSMNDNRVFRRSPLHDALLRRNEPIVAPDEHLVGDGAYTLTDFMMIPFQNNGHLTEEQVRFNKALSQCRVRVENSFARAKGKWRRLKHLHARNPHNVVDHITACFVLHNFLILNGAPMLMEDELRRPIRDNEVLGNDNINEEEIYPNEPAEELLQAAQIRGVEKRIFIMNDVLHNVENEDDQQGENNF